MNLKSLFLLTLILPLAAADDVKEDYTRCIEYGYCGDDKFDTLVKEHNLSAPQISEFKGEGIDEDDERCRGSDNDQVIFSLLIELVTLVDGKTLFQHAYEAASQIREELRTYEPSLIIGIGRSPFMVIDMIQEILKRDGYVGGTQVKHMAFSGSPDISLTKRTDYDLRGNVMVPRRVATIFAYFDELGFDKADKGIWFIDVMGYGSGKNALFRLLREYYKTKGKTQPPTHFFMLTNESMSEFSDPKNVFFHNEIQKKLQYMAGHEAKGIRSMVVPCTVIIFPNWLIHFFDGDRVAMRCAPVQQYRPFMMRSGSEESRSKPGPCCSIFRQAVINGMAYLGNASLFDREELAFELTKVLKSAEFLEKLLLNKLNILRINPSLLEDKNTRDMCALSFLRQILPGNIKFFDEIPSD